MNRKAFPDVIRVETGSAKIMPSRRARSAQRRAAFHADRLIAVVGERAKNRVGVGAVARLHRDVELGALGRHVEKQPMMLDAENIGAELAEPARDLARERPADREW